MDTEQKIKTAKTVTKLIVYKSVGTIAAIAVRTHVPTTNKAEEVQLMIGSYVLAGMVTDRALAWADTQFDDLVKAAFKIKNLLSETPAE